MILLPVLGAVWVMVGGLITWYYPGLMWNTLSASGEEAILAGWKNPFATKSILEFADWFVALQADVIFPHILPGATSTGRPYIVDHATYFANVTSAQVTKASLQDLFSQQNVTYPAVLSGFNHAAPAGHVIDAAAWYGSLAGCFALVLVLVLLTWQNQSVRSANKALSAAASQLDRLFSGLLKVTSRSEPNMNGRLHEFLQIAQQQGWIPDPYQLDLMAHVELIIGLNGQVTLLTFCNGDLSKKYDAALEEVLNLRQALASYQYRCEMGEREAIFLGMTVDRLEAALSSQTQSHSAKVNQLAEDHKTAETINAQQLTEHYEEKIKSLQDEHVDAMDRQAHQLRDEESQKQQLRDELDVVQEKLRNAEDRLALALPASGDTDPGAPTDTLHNSNHEEIHPTVPVDQPEKVKKPTRRRTKEQLAASKRRQLLEKEANGQKPAIPESSSQQNELGPAQTSEAEPQSNTSPNAFTDVLPSDPVDTSVYSLSNAPRPDPSDLTPSPGPALTHSGRLTQVETPQTGLTNEEQPEVTQGKRHNQNMRKKRNQKAKKEAEKEQLEAEESKADKKDQAQIESNPTPALGPSSPPASTSDPTADSTPPSTLGTSPSRDHEGNSSTLPSAPACPVVSSAEKGSSPSNEGNDLDDSNVEDSSSLAGKQSIPEGSQIPSSNASPPTDSTPVQEPLSNDSSDNSAQIEQPPASTDSKSSASITDQASSSRAPFEAHLGSEDVGSGAKSAASPLPATSQQQQTPEGAVPSSTQPLPPSPQSPSSPRLEGGQQVHGDGSGREERQCPSRKGVPLSDSEKAESEKAERELADRELAGKEQAAKEKKQAAKEEKEQAERIEKARAEKQHAEEEQAERAKAQAEKEQAEKAQAEKAQAEKAQVEQAERAKAQAEQAERAKAQAEKAEKELAEKEQAQKALAGKEQADKDQAQKALAGKEQADKDQAEKTKQQAEHRTANSILTPTDQSSSAVKPLGDPHPSKSTNPAPAKPQGFTQPPTRQERERERLRHNNGGQLPPWLNQPTPPGTGRTQNDAGAAIRRQYERHVPPGSEDGPGDGPGKSSSAGPSSQQLVQPQSRSSGKNKRRGQGNRNRRGENREWGAGGRGFSGSGVWGT